MVLWHGVDDRTFPPAAARAMAAQLPQCTSHFVEATSLTLILERWDDILRELDVL